VASYSAPLAFRLGARSHRLVQSYVLMIHPLICEMPVDSDQRWRMVQTVARGWFPGSLAEPGFSDESVAAAESRLGLSLPRELRRWLTRSGALSAVWSMQDRLLPPNRLRMFGEWLIVVEENQNCALWGVSLKRIAEDDPPISLILPSRGAVGACYDIESNSISEFALRFLLANVRFSDTLKASANGQATQAALTYARSRIPATPFQPWHWPVSPSSVLASEELVVHLDGEGDDAWLTVSALNEECFRDFTAPLAGLGIEWQHWSPDGVV
jgi:hypothetical protein